MNRPPGIVRPEPFYNRREELAALSRVWTYLPNGGFAMVYGRRRLGKTFLLQRFLTEPSDSDARIIYYLASQSTAEIQRRELAERLIAALPETLVTIDELAVSWSTLFRYASRRAKELGASAKVALVLDEFPYLVDKSPELPSILQSWWDTEGTHSPIGVVICGSQLSMMAALGNEAAPLHGRFNAGRLLIQPMRFDDVANFYDRQSHYGVAEKLIMYGALGGTPRYHAMVRASGPWDEQLVDLLFRPNCPLEDEIRFLLSSEQIRDVVPYQAVLGAIASGRSKRSEISSGTGIAENALSHTLNALIELGWVVKERPFGETSDSRALYRAADPFVSFNYRFVQRNASALQFGDPSSVFHLNVAPHIGDYMGRFVFESVCGQWLRRHAMADLGIMPTGLGRWWSRDSQIEIDLISPLEDGSTLFGECKWGPVDVADLNRLRAKVAKLPNPDWLLSPRLILFTAGTCSEPLRAIAKADPSVVLVDGSSLF